MNHEDSNAELYRKSLIRSSSEVEMLKQQIRELEEAKYKAYQKIAVLTDELNKYKAVSL